MRSGGIFDYDSKRERLEEVGRELELPSIWDNPQRAQELGKERAMLERIVGEIGGLTGSLVEAKELLDLAISEQDEGTAIAVRDDVEEQAKRVDALEFRRMFSGKMDGHNAFVDIQAGAGGTEAQDWAEIDRKSVV